MLQLSIPSSALTLSPPRLATPTTATFSFSFADVAADCAARARDPISDPGGRGGAEELTTVQRRLFMMRPFIPFNTTGDKKCSL